MQVQPLLYCLFVNGLIRSHGCAGLFVENTEEKIRDLLGKLAIAGESESITLAAELRALLRSKVDSLREKASTLLVIPHNDSGSNAAD